MAVPSEASTKKASEVHDAWMCIFAEEFLQSVFIQLKTSDGIKKVCYIEFSFPQSCKLFPCSGTQPSQQTNNTRGFTGIVRLLKI